MIINIPGTEKSIGGEEIFVVAELGKNFIQTLEERSVEEYLANAKKLVDAAKDAGVDAVKFQTHEVEDEQLNLPISSPHFPAGDRYQWITRNMNATPLEDFWKPLKAYCNEKGIIFFSTPMSRKAAQKLDKLDVPIWKVGSCDDQDFVMLDFMRNTGKPIIMGIGMVSFEELEEVVKFVTAKGSPLVLLYCIAKYPAPPEYFNLASIEYLKEKYPNLVIGFSDHSLGTEISLAAVKLGTKVIEKHFSFSRNLWGADHKSSMTPAEMKELVQKIRSGEYKNIDHAPYYGEKEKELEGATNELRPYFNKCLMAGQDIPEGMVLAKEVIFAMRPKLFAKGLPAEHYEQVLGKKVKQDLKKYDPITSDILYENQ